MPNLLAQGLRNLPKSAQEDLAGYVDPQTYANKLANQLRETTGQADYARWYKSRNPADLKAAREKMVQTAIDWNPAGVGMTVWHGSPHKFDKFDMSKIGTGEGAQAYGHGLYFAESPEVAKDYAKTLGDMSFRYEGKALKPDSVDDVAAQYLFGQSGDKAAALEDAFGNKELQNAIKKMDYSKLERGGVTYKTDIPDEAVARMLDWDKPLSEQAPEVQAAFQGIAPKKYTQENKLGSDLYGLLKQESARHLTNPDYSIPYNDQAASEYLRAQGIPGIRYLDGGSRGTGQGTSNFVLFDDQMPRILEINGQPTGALPWSPSEWKFK